MEWFKQQIGDRRRPLVILAAYALVQIPVFAWTTDGSLTEQVIRFPLVATSRTEVNGELTSYSEIGIDLVAIILSIAVFKWRNAFFRSRVAAPV